MHYRLKRKTWRLKIDCVDWIENFLISNVRPQWMHEYEHMIFVQRLHRSRFNDKVVHTFDSNHIVLDQPKRLVWTPRRKKSYIDEDTPMGCDGALLHAFLRVFSYWDVLKTNIFFSPDVTFSVASCKLSIPTCCDETMRLCLSFLIWRIAAIISFLDTPILARLNNRVEIWDWGVSPQSDDKIEAHQKQSNRKYATKKVATRTKRHMTFTYHFSRTERGRMSCLLIRRTPRIDSKVSTSNTNCVFGSYAQSMVTGGPSVQDGLSPLWNVDV